VEYIKIIEKYRREYSKGKKIDLPTQFRKQRGREDNRTGYIHSGKWSG
jgi:hypothetical protein